MKDQKRLLKPTLLNQQNIKVEIEFCHNIIKALRLKYAQILREERQTKDRVVEKQWIFIKQLQERQSLQRVTTDLQKEKQRKTKMQQESMEIEKEIDRLKKQIGQVKKKICDRKISIEQDKNFLSKLKCKNEALSQELKTASEERNLDEHLAKSIDMKMGQLARKYLCVEMSKAAFEEVRPLLEMQIKKGKDKKMQSFIMKKGKQKQLEETEERIRRIKQDIQQRDQQNEKSNEAIARIQKQIEQKNRMTDHTKIELKRLQREILQYSNERQQLKVKQSIYNQKINSEKQRNNRFLSEKAQIKDSSQLLIQKFNQIRERLTQFQLRRGFQIQHANIFFKSF